MIESLRNKINDLSTVQREIILVICLLCLNLFLVLFYLTPRFLEINPHDGVKYIESGRRLFIWGLRDLSWGPLVAFVYAPIHFFVGQSLNWFMIEAWIGNVVFFILMWVSFYLLARQLEPHLSKYVIIGLLFAWVYYYRIQYHQGDALFLPLSVFALTNLVKFHQYGRLKNLWFASLFVGLGMMSRVETILLIIPLIIFSLVFNKKQHHVYKILLADIVPFAGLFLTFLAVSLATLGHPNLSMAGKSYFSYTHSLVQNFLPGSKNQLAYLRGEPIFGTIEENRGTLMGAILYNPSVLFERVAANLLEVPEKLMVYYGTFHRWTLVFFSFSGLYALIRKRNFALLSLLLIWPSHALVTLVFESLHFIPQLSYIFLFLSGIGITYFLSKEANFTEKLLIMAIAVVLGIISLFLRFHSMFTISILLVIVLGLNLIYEKSFGRNFLINPIPAVVLLAGMLSFQPAFVFPALIIGQSEDELAVQFLQSNFPYQSNVIAYFPRPAIAAKMEHRSFPRSIADVDEFLIHLNKHRIRAIYVDDKMAFPTKLFENALNEYPDLFPLVYYSRSRNIRIYQVLINDE